MPSGPKKRKAAKRRKEQEQQQPGAHPPGSPTSPSTGPSSPLQGNGLGEDDDVMSHDSKGSESGSDAASPTAQGNRHHHLEITGKGAQADATVDAKNENNLKESRTPGSEDVELMDDTRSGGGEIPSEFLAPQEMKETVKETGEDVVVAAVDVRKDEIALLHPSNPILHTSEVVPISEPEAVSVEHVQSEKNKDVSVAGEVPPLMEFKQFEASDTADFVEQPVHHIPISEEMVQATNVPVESLKVVGDKAVTSSNKNEEKLVPLTVATSDKLDPTVESHPGTGKTTGSSEAVWSAHLEQRASWLSCCGLFDVIASR